jgi:hypothetical protein
MDMGMGMGMDMGMDMASPEGPMLSALLLLFWL